MSVEPGSWGTRLDVAPLGSVDFPTHRSFLSLRFSFGRIDLPALKRVAANLPNAEFGTELIGEFERRLVHLIAKTVLLLVVGAALAGALVTRRPRWTIVGACVGLALSGAALGSAWITYDSRAYEKPRFEGLLKAAPLFISSAKHARDYTRSMQRLSGNLYRFFASIDVAHSRDLNGNTRVLVVSDIHNNPITIRLMKRLVDDFGIKAVVDSGDLTDLGSDYEVVLFDEVRSVGVPYVFVPGNHERPEAIGAIEKIRNVKVLRNQRIEVAGLTIYGVDTSSPAMGPAQAELPDILVAHREEEVGGVPGLTGKVPAIISGDSHEMSVRIVGDSVLANPGSSGGSGIRASEPGRKYTFQILYFDKKKRVVAVDSLSLDGKTQEFRLERTVPRRGPSG